MKVLLLADENLGNALEPALRRVGFSVERAQTSDGVTPTAGRLIVAPLKLLRGPGNLLEAAPESVCVLLPPGRADERAALLAAGAAEVFESPVRASIVATRLSELARARIAPVQPPAESTQETTSAPASEEAPPHPSLQATPVPPADNPTVSPSAAAAGTTPAPSLASQLFDTTTWPVDVLSLEAARSALIMRARVPASGSDQVGDVFRTLSEPELAALRAPMPTSSDDLLIRGAAQRLVVRHVAQLAAKLRGGETLVEIDSAAFTALRDATAAIASEFDAAVDRAVREDPGAFQSLAPSRTGITRALRELENAARLLRGELLADDAVPLDIEVGAAPAVPRAAPRKAVVTTYADVPALPRAPRASRTRSGFLIALGIVALVVGLVHAFVLGTFRSRPTDPVIPIGEVAGVEVVRHNGVLEARIPPTPAVAKTAAEIGQHTREPLVITTPDGQPMGFEVHGTFTPAPGFQSLSPPSARNP